MGMWLHCMTLYISNKSLKGFEETRKKRSFLIQIDKMYRGSSVKRNRKDTAILYGHDAPLSHAKG